MLAKAYHFIFCPCIVWSKSGSNGPTGHCLHVLDDHQAWVKSIDLAPDGYQRHLRMISCGWDNQIIGE